MAVPGVGTCQGPALEIIIVEKYGTGIRHILYTGLWNFPPVASFPENTGLCYYFTWAVAAFSYWHLSC